MTQSNSPSDSQGGSNNAQEQAPPVYRSRVRSLLGVPDTGSGSILAGQTVPPPVGFQYQNSPSPEMFSMGHAPAQSFVVETANPMIESQVIDSPPSFSQPPVEDEAPVSPQEESAFAEVQEPVYREQTESFSPPDVSESAQTSAPDSIESNETASVDMPSPTRERGDISGSREAQQVGESAAQGQSVDEPTEQEIASVQQFDINMPGVSKTPQSFPALENIPKDDSILEHRPQTSDSESEEHGGDIQTDAMAARQMPEASSSPESTSSIQRSVIQAVTQWVEGASFPSRRMSSDTGEVEIPVAPASGVEQASVSEQGISETEQRAERDSRVAPSQAANAGTTESISAEPLTRRESLSVEPNGVSDAPYLSMDDANRTYRETLAQIEQIRKSMQQLAARSSNQPQNNGAEQRHEEPPGYVYSPPQPVIIYQRPASRAPSPRAFWARRYLGHLRVRTLR